MEIFKRKIEDPQHAYDRVRKKLLGSVALDSGAPQSEIDRYNMLHAQILLHKDGTRGHLRLNEELVIFEARIIGHDLKLAKLNHPKIPYRLKPGTNIVIPA